MCLGPGWCGQLVRVGREVGEGSGWTAEVKEGLGCLVKASGLGWLAGICCSDAGGI